MSFVIIVVSDNHGRPENLRQVLARHQDEANFFIHCGDSEFNVRDELMQPFISVRGNNDFGFDYENNQTLSLGDFGDIFITHGHMNGAHLGSKTLAKNIRKIANPNVNIVCYGHTHKVEISKDGDILVINPGSLNYPRDSKIPTYIKLEVTATSYEIHVLEASNGQPMKHLVIDK